MFITHVCHLAVKKSQGPRIASRALREQVWTYYHGENFKGKCAVSWCMSNLTVFTFETGHNVPYSKGGTTSIDNLRPICRNCNRRMSNTYTIDEWSKIRQLK